MHRILFFLFPIFIFLACGNQSTDAELSTSSTANDTLVKNGNSLLWKIEGDHIKTSYLFGTMHIINKAFYRFPQSLEARISAADRIIMEMDGVPKPVETFDLLSLDSGSIRDYFTKEQMSALLNFMEAELQMPKQSFDEVFGPFKPVLLLQSITRQYFERDAESYDLAIMQLAGQDSIPIVGLETIGEQLGFFDEIPPNEVATLVMYYVENFEKAKKQTLKLMQHYAKQNIKKLMRLILKQSPEMEKYSDVFIHERNKRWVPKIKAEMQENSCFIAVGAGHLFGTDGLIELLEKEGYTLLPILF